MRFVLNPRVYNKYGRDKIPKSAIYVGRPTGYGNPFRAGDNCRKDGILIQRMGRNTAVRLFNLYAHKRIIRDPNWLEPLKGKSLICYCWPKA